MRRDEIPLRLSLDFLGNCELKDITPLRIQAFIDKRRAQPGRRPVTTLSNATVRNDIHALSNLLKRAHSLRHVSENVITGSVDKPAPPPSRTEFLERDECACLLDAAADLDQEARVASQIRELQRRKRALRDGGDHASARLVKCELQGLFFSPLD